MPSGGHNAKPDGVLKLHGGYRPDVHANRGPKSGGDALRKPDDLGDHASWLWDEITRTRAAWIASSDAASLRDLCTAYQYKRNCELLLDQDATNKDARCSWAAYAQQVNSLGARFGLTPSDRARLGEDKPTNDDNAEMEEMIG